MIFLRENDVRALLPMREAVRLMREMFLAMREGKAQNQPRRRLFTPEGSVLHTLAGSWGKYYGTKIYSTNAKTGTAEFLFWLLDSATAKPLALMEANWLGQIRTGAASGYATDVLAPESVTKMGVIGSGFQARSQVEAVSMVRQLTEVKVWSRSEEKRAKFAEDIRRDLGIQCVAVSSAEEAVRDMPIVTTATWAKDPVVETEWIATKALVNAMGSNHPQRRELPASLVEKASKIVVDALDVAKIESGDLLLAWGGDNWSNHPVIELKDAAGVSDGITIFKSNGLGVEDVAVGGWVYEQALAQGAGKPLPA